MQSPRRRRAVARGPLPASRATPASCSRCSSTCSSTRATRWRGRRAAGGDEFQRRPRAGTVASAALLIIAVLHSVATEPFRLNSALPLTLGLCVLMSVSLMFTEWTPYGVEKAGRFYTLTLLSFLAPVFLIRDRDDARRFFNSLAIGLAITVDASITLFGSLGTTSALSRLKTEGASTISLARIAGTAGIWLVVGMLQGSTRLFIASSVAVAGITIAMLGNGSRATWPSCLVFVRP